MPSNLIKSMAKKGNIPVKDVEAAWEESVAEADKKYKKHDGKYWAFVNKQTQKKLNLEMLYDLEKGISKEVIGIEDW